MSSYQEALMEEALVFHRHEMDTDGPCDRAFSNSCKQAAKLLGVTDLDGNEDDEGYSIDSASDAQAAGISPKDYAKGHRAKGWSSRVGL